MFIDTKNIYITRRRKKQLFTTTTKNLIKKTITKKE